MTRSETAEYITRTTGLVVSDATMRNWGYKGRGPAYCKPMGKCLYSKANVDEWIKKVTTAGGK